MYLPDLLYKCTKRQLINILKSLGHQKITKSSTKWRLISDIDLYDDSTIISSLKDDTLRTMLRLQGISTDKSVSAQRKILLYSLYPKDSYRYKKEQVLELLQELIGFGTEGYLSENIAHLLDQVRVDGNLQQFKLIHQEQEIYDEYDSIYKNYQIVKHKPTNIIIGFTFFHGGRDGEIWINGKSNEVFTYLEKRNITIYQEAEIYYKSKKTEVHRKILTEKIVYK